MFGKKAKWIVGTMVLLFLLIIAFFGSSITPYDGNKQDLAKALMAPCKAHLLGTDRYGRDMLSRVILGAKTSIFATLGLVGVASIIGTVVGIFCGYIGGTVDLVLMGIVDVFMAFPGMVFALAVAGAMGGGMGNATIALTAILWPKYARITRSQVLQIKNMTYIKAAKLNGCGHGKIIIKHLVPNLASIVVVTAALDLGTMMIEMAGLSFLGLGAMPPTAEWGLMMSNGRSMIQTAPWVILAPGVAIFITVSLFNLWADCLRDGLDPRMGSTVKREGSFVYEKEQ